MKKTIKYSLIFISMASLFALLCVSAFASGGISEFSVSSADTASASDLGAVEWYKSPADGKYYVFLPADADTGNLKVWFTAEGDVYCGENKLTSGQSAGIFAGCGEYTISCNDASYQVVFIKAEGAGTIYINTESGSLDAVHADKENKEPGTIEIADEDGTVYYEGDLDHIKGRGNSTWSLAKKPYNIKLNKKADLFGLGKSKKWTLLANANDNTMIRNQLNLGLAYALGITQTPETAQVNLYVNGEYLGLYLLTERVEIDDYRVEIYDLESETEDVNEKDLDAYPLGGAQKSQKWSTIKYAEIPNNPDDITGGYLLEFEKIYRYPNEVSGFITDLGQAIVVKEPEYASKEQVEYISGYYQEFEEALYSSTGYNSLGKHYSEYIDLESLAGMYIIEEFLGNFDGCSSSFFLYKDIGGKLYAGPAWDMDLSLGVALSNNLINHVDNVADPNLLYIKTCFIGNHNESKYGFLAQAYTHNDFQAVVSEVWANVFKSYYDTYTSNITDFSQAIKTSVYMNSIRWNTYGSTDKNNFESRYNGDLNVIKNYLAARYPFMDKAFAADTYYVKYDIGEYGTKLINDSTFYKAGDTAVAAAAPDSSKSYMEFKCWSTNPDGSGDTYAAGDEITVNGNTNLYAQWEMGKSITDIINAFLDALREFFNTILAFFSNIFN